MTSIIRRGKKMKRKHTGKILALIVAFALVFSAAVPGFADSAETYVAMGADLTQDQRTAVLGYLGLSEDDMNRVDSVSITNALEYQYLGSYLPPSVIGTKALSCVRVDKKKKGGINVKTVNISYCTEGMYQNALITAGIENADVTVAGPFSISGTAGLVGAMQAYQGITGVAIEEENADAAVEEIVTTGDLAQAVGSEDAENLVALIKQEVIENDNLTDEDILGYIEKGASELGITLSDSEKQSLLSLMKKIAALDIDPDKLKKQAENIYNRLSDFGIDLSGLDKDSIIDKITGLIEKVVDFFKGLFS